MRFMYVILFEEVTYINIYSQKFTYPYVKLNFIFILLRFHILLVEYFITLLFSHLVVINYEVYCEKVEIKTELCE